MADVGALAGVSTCTVSRAFNSPETVRPPILERVRKAAEELNYQLNPAAKALRLQTTRIFGLVLPTLDHAMFAKMANSFQTALNAAGYAPVVVTAGFDNSRMATPLRTIMDRGAEGLLIVGKIEDAEVRRFLKRTHLPVVTTYSHLGDDDEIPSIGFDNYHSVRQAVDYLISLGHRRMAMIAGPSTGNDRQRSRIQAFRDARVENGIEEPWPVLERAYDSAYSAGAEAIRDLRSAYPNTTALVCNSDTFAIGAMLEAQRMGVRVPEDISIIGHDDLELAALLEPSLSTVAVPATEMGQRCAQALLNAKADGTPILSRCLKANLIIRRSTAPAPERPFGG